ncbi:MAG: hypothetical protein COA74_09770 [Gammaproteobacteria bacterium]|nr:MAG: hypothetical protein COA74_09770 [Gammaproteobacteria bacterium]
MKLQSELISQFNRRKIKCLIINAMGVIGVIIALIAILFAQDQVELITQVSQQLTQSPVGSVITAIKSLF